MKQLFQQAPDGRFSGAFFCCILQIAGSAAKSFFAKNSKFFYPLKPLISGFWAFWHGKSAPEIFFLFCYYADTADGQRNHKEICFET